MAKVKLTMLVMLSGSDGSLNVGDTVEVDNATAIRYITKGVAETKTKKEHDSLIAEAAEIEAKEADKKAQVKAILEEEALRNDLISLATDTVMKAAEVDGVILEDMEVLPLVENLIENIGSDLSKENKELKKTIKELEKANKALIEGK